MLPTNSIISLTKETLINYKQTNYIKQIIKKKEREQKSRHGLPTKRKAVFLFR